MAELLHSVIIDHEEADDDAETFCLRVSWRSFVSNYSRARQELLLTVSPRPAGNSSIYVHRYDVSLDCLDVPAWHLPWDPGDRHGLQQPCPPSALLPQPVSVWRSQPLVIKVS